MFTHIDKDGAANMVDVTEKSTTQRIAIAQSSVQMSPETFAKVITTDNPKGDIFATARIAGIQGAKKCSDLIPLCHPLMLTSVKVDIQVNEAEHCVEFQCRCKLSGQTGVEMEALTGASIAALTFYDMCKAIDKHMVIGEVKLIEKSGGKSGDWQRSDDAS